jgi:hypothetical protein
MMLLLAAALLPRLFIDAGPEAAPKLKEAGIQAIAVPAAQAAAWKALPDITVETIDPARAVKLRAPSVDYRANQGSASRSPWINSNGWRFLRTPQATFLYDVKGPQAALAAAEAFMFGGNAVIQSDDAGLKPLAEMLALLRSVPPADLPPISDIAFVDDGTPAAGEVMNLMVKSNLLFRAVSSPDRSAKLNVKLGTKEFPLEDAKNPGKMSQLIRSTLTDDKRSLRVYGTVTVVGRVTGNAERVRIQLLNYAGAERQVNGVRVRVLGKFSKHDQSNLVDFTVEPDATEFTLPELKTFAVIDLTR